MKLHLLRCDLVLPLGDPAGASHPGRQCSSAVITSAVITSGASVLLGFVTTHMDSGRLFHAQPTEEGACATS
jgi:hypothetical protein